MDNSNKINMIKGLNLNKPALLDEIEQIPFLERLPVDYVEFLKHANGGHGSVGIEHLILFPAQEIDHINKIAEIDKFAPGLLIFASNGGGQSYAFDLRNEKTSIVKFYDMDMGCEEPIKCAETLQGLLGYLFEQT